ncbi:mucin-17-like [Hyperolius riggenbachi]|uniref:mucin-17-like n=1 Tax=Hyperolius riggenbachi TaxID=752182 RepID=UPI0035A394E9
MSSVASTTLPIVETSYAALTTTASAETSSAASTTTARAEILSSASTTTAKAEISSATPTTTARAETPSAAPTAPAKTTSQEKTSAVLTPTEDIFTVEMTMTPATTTITHPTETTIRCQNGGTNVEGKCICTDNYEGDLCESVVNKVPVGKSFSVSVNVALKIINVNFSVSLTDNSTEDYKSFEVTFKLEMGRIYSNISGYKDVIIRDIRQGSVLVDHDVIVEMDYKKDEDAVEQYYKACEELENKLDTLAENQCTLNGTGGLCINGSSTNITQGPLPLRKEEICMEKVPGDLKEFYTPVVLSGGLFCASHCHTDSPEYLDCHEGTCQLQVKTGPHCLCPKINKYIYMNSDCTGKILKDGLYGGIGAAIAVLVVIIGVITFYCCRYKRSTKRFINNRDAIIDEVDSWFEDDKEDEWKTQKGIVNINNMESQADIDSPNNYQPTGERFIPTLENVNTEIQIKIQRPQVSIA